MINKKIKLAAAIVTACAALPVGTLAATPGISELATHPQCHAIGSTVFVRGAVAVAENGAPVSGARVKLAYGAATRYVISDTSGVYQVEFPRTAARAVREVATAIAAPTGTLIPVEAREGGNSCTVPVAHVGELRELEGRRVKQ